MVFGPEDFVGDKRLDSLSALSMTQGELLYPYGHFSNKRFAVLFKPGDYDIEFRVGYYVQVLGLGARPEDVRFTTGKGVYCPPTDPNSPSWNPDHKGSGSLDTFWRSVENIQTGSDLGFEWAVSQAAPLRRVHAKNALLLSRGDNYSSGGFMSNVIVDGNINFGTQQQFMTRNSEFWNASNGAWSLVFAGCKSIEKPEPLSTRNYSNEVALTVVPNEFVMAEKPFITYETGQDDVTGMKYYLHIPEVRQLSDGADFRTDGEFTKKVPFDDVFVAIPTDSTKDLQDALDRKNKEGEACHLLLTPGIYYLTSTLVISQNNQVVLGLGLATLVAPPGGLPVLLIKDGCINVRVAGLLLEASANTSFAGSTLLKFGETKRSVPGAIAADDSKISGVLSDVFARVGGSNTDKSVGVQTIMEINANNVIGDNLWLWRADHAALEVRS